MRKMPLKMLLMSILMIFAGWQSFAGIAHIDSVYALANNKILFTIPTGSLSAGDSVGWFFKSGTTLTAISGTGYTFGNVAGSPGYIHDSLKVTGSTATEFQQPTDSLTARPYIIDVVIYSAGGCISTDTSEYRVLVLPYLKSMAVSWIDSSALCGNNSVSDTLKATKPALTGAWSTVKVGAITWWSKDVTTPTTLTQITAGITANNTVTPNTSNLGFMTPTNTDNYQYQAQAPYNITGSPTIVVSTANTGQDGHTTSRNVNIQATAAPTAPTLNGSVQGW